MSLVAELDLASAPSTAQSTRRLTWAHVLALVGVVFTSMQVYTWVSWARTGPVQIDRFRDTSDISWKLAIGYQVIAVALLIGLGGHVVRQCLRQRRLTFDAKFCIASLATFWLDPAANFVLPVYSYSAQWINLNDWLGQMPFVRNPDGGRLPEPILFLLPIYAVGWLLFIILINAAMRALQRRRPMMKPSRVLGIALLGALIVDVIFELPMFLFNLWSNQGAPRFGLFAGSGQLYPVTEMLIAVLCFAALASLRYYRNDLGETIVERGTVKGGRLGGGWTTQFALIGLFNSLWVLMAVLWTVFGLFSGPWREMKPWVTNGVCDAPGVTGTRYGPCPGSPEFDLPGPSSLLGESPGGKGEYLNGPTQCDGCPVLRVEGAEPLERSGG